MFAPTPRILLAALTLAALAACEAPEPETYPLSGEPCSEEDRVKGIDAGDCLPPSGVTPGLG